MPAAEIQVPVEDVQERYWWEDAWERGELSDDDIWRIIVEATTGFGEGLWSSTIGLYKLLLPSTWMDMGKGMYLAYQHPQLVKQLLIKEFKKAPVKAVSNGFASFFVGPVLVKYAGGALKGALITEGAAQAGSTVEGAAATLVEATADVADDVAAVGETAKAVVEQAAGVVDDVAAAVVTVNESVEYLAEFAEFTKRVQELKELAAQCEKAQAILEQLAKLHPDQFNAGECLAKVAQVEKLVQAGKLGPQIGSQLSNMRHWIGEVGRIAWHNTNKGGKKSGRVAEMARQAALAAERAKEAGNALSSTVQAMNPPVAPTTVTETVAKATSAVAETVEVVATIAEPVAEVAPKASSVVTGVNAAQVFDGARRVLRKDSPSRSGSEEGHTQAEDIEELNRQLRELRATIELLREALIQRDEDFRRQQEESGSREEGLREAYQELMAQFSAAQALVTSLQVERDNLRLRLTIAEGAASELSEACDNLAIQIMQQKADLMAGQTESQATVVEGADIERLERELSKLRSELEEKTQAREVLGQDLAKSLEQHQESLALQRELEHRVGKLQTENAALLQDVEFAEDELTRMQHKTTALSRQVGFWQQRCETGAHDVSHTNAFAMS